MVIVRIGKFCVVVKVLLWRCFNDFLEFFLFYCNSWLFCCESIVEVGFFFCVGLKSFGVMFLIGFVVCIWFIFFVVNLLFWCIVVELERWVVLIWWFLFFLCGCMYGVIVILFVWLVLKLIDLLLLFFGVLVFVEVCGGYLLVFWFCNLRYLRIVK